MSLLPILLFFVFTVLPLSLSSSLAFPFPSFHSRILPSMFFLCKSSYPISPFTSFFLSTLSPSTRLFFVFFPFPSPLLFTFHHHPQSHQSLSSHFTSLEPAPPLSPIYPPSAAVSSSSLLHLLFLPYTTCQHYSSILHPSLKQHSPLSDPLTLLFQPTYTISLLSLPYPHSPVSLYYPSTLSVSFSRF